jgi:uncharacterized protein YuzE
MKKVSTSSSPRTTKISYDSQAKALYIRVSKNKVFKTKAITSNFIVDIDRKGKLVGVEILNTTQATQKDAIRSWLDFDVAKLVVS